MKRGMLLLAWFYVFYGSEQAGFAHLGPFIEQARCVELAERLARAGFRAACIESEVLFAETGAGWGRAGAAVTTPRARKP